MTKIAIWLSDNKFQLKISSTCVYPVGQPPHVADAGGILN